MIGSKSVEHWLASREARGRLHVSACHLMHLRLEGRVQHRKQGNAFLYSAEDIERLLQESRSAREKAGLNAGMHHGKRV